MNFSAQAVKKGERLAAGPTTGDDLAERMLFAPKRVDSDAAAYAIWRRAEDRRMAGGGEFHGYTGRIGR